jgi:L-ribulokinase
VSLVAGVDFGTLNVRVSIFDSERGRIGAGIAHYPLKRSREDPLMATQSHSDHMRALEEAMRLALASSGVEGYSVEAVAIDTTGSSVLPVGRDLEPLDDYYMWCDHRAWREAALITQVAQRSQLPAIDWCGGAYSSEWGFSKLLHWLRNNPERRVKLVTALEHCDMVTSVLCGITDPECVPRSICAMGHKWMWNETLGGLPSEEFLSSVDPLFKNVRAKIARGHYSTSEHAAGSLSETWAKHLGLRAGIPVPIGALDAHWDAIGAGIKVGNAVNVVGTSTCIIGMSQSSTPIPGLCGVVPGSVYPHYTGIEAGLSATGDIFEAIARRAQTTLGALSERVANYKAGQTGLLRIPWDNGDRTVLVNPELAGITFGWNLMHTAEDELFAGIEGTALHTRIILEHMEKYGVQVACAINAGGISRKNAVLNQVYANVLNRPILVPEDDITGLGSAIFAFLIAGAFRSIEEAQNRLCPSYRTFEPEESSRFVYDELFWHFRQIYLSFGNKDSVPVQFGRLFPALRNVASTAHS